jgi:hypothetical protein
MIDNNNLSRTPRVASWGAGAHPIASRLLIEKQLRRMSQNLREGLSRGLVNGLVNVEYRYALLPILARLDRVVAEVDAILDRPGDIDIDVLAEDLRESIVEMRDMVEEKLDRGAP